MYKKSISPSSLQDLCLDAFCDNLIHFIEPAEEEHNKTSKYPVKKYRFRDPELILHNEISESFMAKLVEKQRMCDCSMSLFNSKNTVLKNVRLRDCEVGQDGLQVLKQHKISKLECSNLTTKSSSISNILGSLNEWTMANMTDANLSNCTANDYYLTRDSLMARMPNMRNLNLSCTDFDQVGLEIICENLKLLEKLDISNTFVVDLRPLIQLSDRLISLSIGDLFNVEFYSYTIRQLNKLRFLDVNILNRMLTVHPNDTSMTNIPLYYVLADTHSLPELRSLDISGWLNFVPTSTVLDYVAAHPKLRYLGCVLNDISFDIGLQNVAPPDLVIGGLGDEQQIKVALVVYRDRSDYAEEVLMCLQLLTTHFPEPREDMVDLILCAMAAHPKVFDVQMQSAECLYNFTRSAELSEKIHPQVLGRAVNLMLNAMECFPDRITLQRMLILTLTSHAILTDINFDHLRCAELVLDALCKFEDEDIDLFAPFIISVLPARETCRLGARPRYMRKLLAIIRNSVDSRALYDTLKFTLNALKKILISSVAASIIFLDQGGADLLPNVLKTFKGDSVIESQVLGLLFNMALKPILQPRLMLDSLMSELLVLLKSENFDVSCYAAGIVANLAFGAYDSYEWKLTSHSRGEMLRALEDTVSQWKAPEDGNEIEDYPCLGPFLRLLMQDIDFQVHLYAVWVIYYKCTNNPKIYCSMLQNNEGDLFLDYVRHSSKFDPEIRMITNLILETVAQHVVG